MDTNHSPEVNAALAEYEQAKQDAARRLRTLTLISRTVIALTFLFYASGIIFSTLRGNMTPAECAVFYSSGIAAFFILAVMFYLTTDRGWAWFWNLIK